MKVTVTNPRARASVSASADTGKIWLLETWLIRLLLTGTKPGDILAVTYIRKMAAETQTRLNARLLEMGQCPESELIDRLSEIEALVNDDPLKRAQL